MLRAGFSSLHGDEGDGPARVVRQASAERLEDDHRERVEVRPLVHLRRAADLLRRHVRDGAHGLARRRQRLAVVHVELAHAEVEDARALAPPGQRLDEDVAGLEVAVDDARGVRVDEPVQHVLADVRDLVPREQARRGARRRDASVSPWSSSITRKSSPSGVLSTS